MIPPSKERTCDISPYKLYGCTLASDFSLAGNITRGGTRPHLSFHCVSGPLLPNIEEEGELVFSSVSSDGDHIDSYLYCRPQDDVLRFAGIADFRIGDEEIVCHLQDESYAYAVEIWLLGGVLAYWFERQSIPALHASSVVVDGRSIAFLASNRGGKSSLAASFMQAGHPLLTDDILLLEKKEGAVTGRPGYPQMRMWPDQARHFLGHCDDLQPVHPYIDKLRIPVGNAGGLGSFCNQRRPLVCLYVPLRREPEETNEIDISPMSTQEALMHLMRHSFLADVLVDARWQPRRLHLLAEIARRVPMRRLVYPSGMEYLPAVRQAILDDVRGVPESR